MIFVTVGTQLPYPRLIEYMDGLSSRLDEQVIAQTGVNYHSGNMRSFPACTELEMEHYCDAARIIVAHAGIGTVITARRLGKPLIVVPRRQALSEHRNDHQVATAEALMDRAGLRVAWDEAEIEEFLRSPIEKPEDAPGDHYVSLLETLRNFSAA